MSVRIKKELIIYRSMKSTRLASEFNRAANFILTWGSAILDFIQDQDAFYVKGTITHARMRYRNAHYIRVT